jgi:hypothetical protein
VRNNGPGTQPNVTVSDTLPAGLQFVSATPSQGSCNAASPIVCTLGALVGGSQATITLTVLVTATSGSIVNTATVSPETDNNPANNTDDAPAVFPTGGPAGAEQIPTLSEWMLLALMGMLGVVAVFRMRT